MRAFPEVAVPPELASTATQSVVNGRRSPPGRGRRRCCRRSTSSPSWPPGSRSSRRAQGSRSAAPPRRCRPSRWGRGASARASGGPSASAHGGPGQQAGGDPGGEASRDPRANPIDCPCGHARHLPAAHAQVASFASRPPATWPTAADPAGGDASTDGEPLRSDRRHGAAGQAPPAGPRALQSGISASGEMPAPVVLASPAVRGPRAEAPSRISPPIARISTSACQLLWTVTARTRARAAPPDIPR